MGFKDIIAKAREKAADPEMQQKAKDAAKKAMEARKQRQQHGAHPHGGGYEGAAYYDADGAVVDGDDDYYYEDDLGPVDGGTPESNYDEYAGDDFDDGGSYEDDSYEEEN
jgi:hypothetical protein